MSSSPKNPAKLDRARSLLEFLNQESGHNYRPTPVNLEFLLKRIDEGYSDIEIRGVIIRKCRLWKNDDKMGQYLRPATLFNATKFNQYVGEVPTIAQPGGES